VILPHAVFLVSLFWAIKGGLAYAGFPYKKWSRDVEGDQRKGLWLLPLSVFGGVNAWVIEDVALHGTISLYDFLSGVLVLSFFWLASWLGGRYVQRRFYR
jgi:hypothetical protein